MSQERNPSRNKSPSRIPVFSSATPSTQRKNPVMRLPVPSAHSTPVSRASPKSHIQKLQSLAKADVQIRAKAEQSSSKIQGSKKKFSPWVEKHLPQSLDELFVHKKKVEEVQTWMDKFYSSSGVKSSVPRICVLSGPSGAGKTATACVLAKSFDAEVKEWINPVSLTEYRQDKMDGFRDEVFGRNQTECFADFLFRIAQYRSLPIKGKIPLKHKLTLVEDIPNVLYKDPNVFHEIIRKYSKCGMSPLVFVFTDSTATEHSLYKMFPKSLMTELNILNITFNGIATTYMVKFLRDICEKETIQVQKEFLEEIVCSANGDIRCAVNNLQFALTQEQDAADCNTSGPFRKPFKRIKRLRSDQTPASDIQQKDETIQLFRALGKVLYAKRAMDKINPVEMELSEDMRRLHPLIDNPDNICDKIEVSTDTFLGFLHQNYPTFYASIDDVKNAAEYLSIGDFIVSGWKFDDSGCRAYKTREVKEFLGMNIAMRGLMHFNKNEVPKGWKPLTKPLVANLSKQISDSIDSTRQVLFHRRELQSTLFSEAIPFHAKLLQIKKSQEPIVGRAEILEKGLFQTKTTRIINLDEKDTVDDESTEENNEENANVKKPEDNAVKTSVSKGQEMTDQDDGLDEEFEIDEFYD